MSVEIPGLDDLKKELSASLTEVEGIESELTRRRELALKKWQELADARQLALEDILKSMKLGICGIPHGSYGLEDTRPEQEQLGILPKSQMSLFYIEEIKNGNVIGRSLNYICDQHLGVNERYLDRVTPIGGKSVIASRVQMVGNRLITNFGSKDITDLPVLYLSDGMYMEPIYDYFVLPRIPVRPVFPKI